MLRYLQSVAIVVFFGVMMFLLFRDHVIPSYGRSAGIEVDRSVLTDTWVNQDEWLLVKLGDMTIGSLRTSAEAERSTLPEVVTRFGEAPLPERYTSAAHLDFGQGPLRGRLLTVVELNRRLELETVRVRAHLSGFGGADLTAEELDAEELPDGAYELLGRVEGSVFYYRLRRGEAVQFGNYRLSRPVTVADSITPILRGNMLSQNVTYTVDIFDPLMGGNSASNAEIEWVDTIRQPRDDEGFQSIRVIELRYQGLRTRLYVDANGTVMRREIPLFASAQGSAPIGDDARAARIIFERVPPEFARDRMPTLAYLPEPRPISASEVRGTNKGEVIQGLSAFSLLGGALPTPFNQTRGEN